MRELYISIDVETNGPIPGPNSMLSLGAVALLDGEEVGSFEQNLQELEGSAGDPDTMEWWSRQPKEIWEACRSNLFTPEAAMANFVRWISNMEKLHHAKAVCVAYPAGFDFLFVYWYIVRFGQKSPFSFSCLDMKTFAAATLRVPYRQATKKNMPREWFEGLPPHTHKALDDAREQGFLFLNMTKHNANA